MNGTHTPFSINMGPRKKNIRPVIILLENATEVDEWSMSLFSLYAKFKQRFNGSSILAKFLQYILK